MSVLRQKRTYQKEVQKMAKSLQKKKICIGFKTKFMFGIMRMMQLKNWSASPVEKEYWKEQGWLGKQRSWK